MVKMGYEKETKPFIPNRQFDGQPYGAGQDFV